MNERTVRSLLDERAISSPDQFFLIDPDSGETLSFGEMRARAARVASFVAINGIEPGMSVAYATRNGAAACSVILGLMYGGFRATAINLAAGPTAISYALSHSKSRMVFVDDDGRSLVEEADASVELVDVAGPFEQNHALEPPHPEDTGLLMYTSGTTGRPKGVLLTHRTLLAGGDNTALAHELDSKDRGLCVLPLFHINGLCVTLMGALVSGGSLVMPRKFSPSRFWGLIAENDCSWFSVVPTQISYLLHQPQSDRPSMPRLRFGRSASAPLSPEVQEAFEARFDVPIIETMGLTECAAQILSNPLPPRPRKIGSPGIAFGNRVKIGDPEGGEAKRGETGEILVKGANVMSGYLDDPQSTAAAFTPSGWFRTGDLARMDEDGYVFVTGRLKELIIKGGENIAPREIDEALYAVPGIIEAAAFARPCTQYGQRVEAAVVTERNIDESLLLDACRARLGPFKSPDRIYFLAELPKGPSGKIQRLALADICDGLS